MVNYTSFKGKLFIMTEEYPIYDRKDDDKIIGYTSIGDMAVINLNNMFPVSDGIYSLKNPKTEKNLQYQTLLNNEIRIIRKKQELIINNEKSVYNHKLTNDGNSKLSQRCNDFKLLEIKCKQYSGLRKK